MEIYECSNGHKHKKTTLLNPTIDYGSIQQAYHKKDGEASKKYHQIKDNLEEYHKTPGSDVIKSIIFGGLDGIITIFSIICSGYASNLTDNTIIILGFSNILAAAISMGHGDYFSEKTEQDYIKDQYRREQWEMDNYREGEIIEMKQIYKETYKIPLKDTNLILDTMANHKALFVDHMMVLELGLLPPDLTVNPIKNGIVTFLSFYYIWDGSFTCLSGFQKYNSGYHRDHLYFRNFRLDEGILY